MTTTWTPQQLQQQLMPFDWSLSAPTDDANWQAYLSHYQLPSAAEGYSHYAGTLDLPEHSIAVQLWQPLSNEENPKPPQATALITHGLYDHVGLYRHLIRYCLARDWQVVAFDLPGHGLSGGVRSSIDSFQEYDGVFTRLLSNLAVQLNQPIHAFGQSTGGAIIANYLLKNSVTPEHSPFASVNFIAPLVRPREWRKIRSAYWLLKHFKKTIVRGRSINSQDAEFLDFLWHHDPLQAGELGTNWLGALLVWERFIQQCSPCQVPINIVQGDDDNSVLWRYNLPFLKEKFPQHCLKIIHTGRHHLVNETEALRRKMWTFFDEVIPA